jgi:hypothetical protein
MVDLEDDQDENNSVEGFKLWDSNRNSGVFIS